MARIGVGRGELEGRVEGQGLQVGLWGGGVEVRVGKVAGVQGFGRV
jgi:hypothetical protein